MYNPLILGLESEIPTTLRPELIDPLIRKKFEVSPGDVTILRGHHSVRFQDSGSVVNVLPFQRLFQEAFHVRIKSDNTPYLLALKIIDQSNHDDPTNAVAPIVQRDGRSLHYYLPSNQFQQAKDLLNSRADDFEPYLPFRITSEELEKLRVEDLPTRVRLTRRLFWAGVTYLPNLPENDQLSILTKVIHNPRLWSVLKDSNPGTFREVGGFRYFMAALRSRNINYHRDTERAKRVKYPYQYLEDGPLREFFIANPPGSETAQKLLDSLPEISRDLFKLHFLGDSSLSEIADSLALNTNFVDNKYNHAKNLLGEIVELPEGQWIGKGVVAQMRRLRQSQPELFERYLRKASPGQRDLVNLRYIQELSFSEIASRLGKTLGAVKALEVRFRQGLEEFSARHIN